MKNPPSLKHLLKKVGKKDRKNTQKNTEHQVDESGHENLNERIQSLQMRMLKVQQGLWYRKERAIFLFEGFDASGKGGVIRTVIENLDPRGVRVHAIGPPDPKDQGKHYLYRFWRALPEPGVIAIFDRTWYGRVLVEKVEGLTPRKRIDEAYDEIHEFEKMLVQDGVHLIKIFLGVSRDEQLRRFEQRLNDPAKLWKIGPDDVRARKKWDRYVDATDVLFQRTHRKHMPWHLVASDHKLSARAECLKIITDHLHPLGKWMDEESKVYRRGRKIEEELKSLESHQARK